VQQVQQNYNLARGLALPGLMVLVMAGAAEAGIATRKPLLHDGMQGPCDPRLAGPEYAPGTDVNGNPVAPAGLARGAVPVPDEVLVPLNKRGRHGRSAEGPMVAIDGRSLDPILNPLPACPVKGR
jgi:hypothetical protein